MNVKDLNTKSRCDDGHVFESRDIERKVFGTGFSAPLAPICFATPDGELGRGRPAATDCVLACPVCHRVQLFGFDTP